MALASVFIFIAFAALLVLVVGLFNPGLVTPWSAEPNRSRVVLTYGLAALAGFAGFVAVVPKEPVSDKPTPSEPVEAAEAEPAPEPEPEDSPVAPEVEQVEESQTESIDLPEAEPTAERIELAEPEQQRIALPPPEPRFDGITNPDFMAIRREMRGRMTDLQFDNLQRDLVGRRVKLRGTVQDVNADGSVMVDLDPSGSSVSDVHLSNVPRNVGSTISRSQTIEFEGRVSEVRRSGIVGSLILSVQATSIEV